MLSFEYAWLFWLLPLPLLVAWLVPAPERRRPAVRVPFVDRLRELGASGDSSGTTRSRRLTRQLGLGLVWLLVVASLARPQWLEEPISRDLPTRDLLLLVDLSGSMEHEDFTDEAGDTIDRLSAVKGVLDEFLEQREGDRVGLVVFGNAAFVQTPFTSDLDLCRALLDEIQVRMAGPKTALGDAMGLGINLFEGSEMPSRTMIALTDGNDTGSGMPPEKAAQVAHDRGITIHTVAVGDPEAVGEDKLDEAALKAVAATTGGKFFRASDREQLAGIYAELDELETSEVETVSHRPRRDLFWLPLAAAAVLSLGWSLVAAGVEGVHRRRRLDESARPAVRIRVNRRTGKLEVTT